MAKQIYVNLPVQDLQKSRKFFESLGFSFNEQFTDDQGACLVLGENIFAMLLKPEFFKSFLKEKNIIDTRKGTEVITAIDATDRKEVDTMVDKALQSGGKPFRDPDDHGWMYSRSFQDPDGHIWEVVTMDMSKMPERP